MSGRANKKLRKLGRLQRSDQQRHFSASGERTICPLYFYHLTGSLYRSWVDCGSAEKARLWVNAATHRMRGSDEAGGLDLARRLPLFSLIYGRFIPLEAAYMLDLHIDKGTLPMRSTEGAPVADVPVGSVAAPRASGASANARIIIHEIHAQGHMIISEDGTVIAAEPCEPSLD